MGSAISAFSAVNISLLFYFHLPVQVGHFYGGESGIPAFIAPFRPRPLDGLLQVIGGEDAERDGNFAL